MKLTSTLSHRTDFLYLAPLLNVILLLLIFFLLNSSLVVPAGVRVELPMSASSLRPLERAQVLTLTAGENPEIYLGREKVMLADLPAKLQAAKQASRQVIISADALAPHGLVVKVQDIIWAAGCQPAIASRFKEEPAR
ncbi:MAG: biopolymer transporter ExbD [Verrucomicrobiales bacterium]|nr:biopolymer transporter ExbD [Verrucomicrobiales bacterium]